MSAPGRPAIALAVALAVLACAESGQRGAADAVARSTRTHRQPLPSDAEGYCAWFGEADDGVLYFGESAFWAAHRRSGGHATAALARAGPRRVGRFDLRTERFLDPIDVAGTGAATRSGVWDVLPRGGRAGRIYFTTYFELAGSLDLATGRLSLFSSAGRFLNELAPGPEPGQILATRYADLENGGGAVVLLDSAGRVLAEHPLPAPAGHALAAKSVAWDPVRGEFWVTTDLLPPQEGPAAAFPHPTLVLSSDGREVARFGTEPAPLEIQFARFDANGRGLLAVVRDERLELAVLGPDAERRDLAGASWIELDSRFPRQLDFAQDIQIAPDGSVVVTRWSGLVHVVDATGRPHTLQLPRSGDALYYSAVLEGGRLCATRCDASDVVCTDTRWRSPSSRRRHRENDRLRACSPADANAFSKPWAPMQSPS